MQMKGEVHSRGVCFSMDLNCFHRSPLPEASCCPMNSCSFPVDVVVGCVGMYGYPILLISHLHCLMGSLILIFYVLLVSPMYTLEQSLQGTW